MVDRLWRWVFILAFPIRQRLRHWLRLEHGGAFIAVRSGDEVLVVRHSYRPGLDFPGGGIGRHERPEAAAVRELAEEVGLSMSAASLTRLGWVRRRHRERDCLFEVRTAVLPEVEVDHREIVWAGPLSEASATWRDLEMPVRWYLRRHLPTHGISRC